MEKVASHAAKSKHMIVHFCFGMTPDFGGRPFGFSHYLAVRSAWEVLKPDVMVMHYVHEPHGQWWELARPFLHLHQVRPVEGIYGFPASHPAHRADIVRLAALIAIGGVYLDTDVLVLKPFDALGDPDFAAAWEFTGDGRLVGLSNAVLMAKPDSHFARLCLEGHNPKKSLWSGFRANGRDHNYVEMSVRYPAMLASLCPTMVKALPQETFLWADWSEDGMRRLFVEDVEVPEGVLALHLWESHAWEKYLSNLTPKKVREGKATFHRLARRFLPEVCGRGASASQAELGKGDFQKMDAICAEVDFVSSEPKRSGFLGRIARRAAKIVERTSSPLKTTTSQLPTPNQFSPEKLEEQLPKGSFSVLVLTEHDLECEICKWLLQHPNSNGVMAFTNLQVARDMDKLIKGSDAGFRYLYHDKEDSLSLRKIIDATFEGIPDLLLVGNGNQVSECLSQLGESMPSMLLVSCDQCVGLNLEKIGYELMSPSSIKNCLFFTLRRGGILAGGRLKKMMQLKSIYGDEVIIMDQTDSICLNRF